MKLRTFRSRLPASTLTFNSQHLPAMSAETIEVQITRTVLKTDIEKVTTEVPKEKAAGGESHGGGRVQPRSVGVISFEF
jgi:hypothetical protein